MVLALACTAMVGCPDDPRLKEVRLPVASFSLPAKDGAAATPTHISQRRFLQELTWAGAGRVLHDERKAVAQHVLRRVIDEGLIAAYAKQQNITISDDDVDREVRRVNARYDAEDFDMFVHNEQMSISDHRVRVQRRLVSDKVYKRAVGQAREVNDAEVQRAYDATVLKNPKPEQVRARHILVATEEEASHIASELSRKRLSFEEAAKQYSDGPEGQRGGDLGWFAKGTMPKVFDGCFDMKTNAVSDVVQSDLGFHIFQRIGHRKAGYVPSLLEVKPQLVAELQRKKEREAMARFIENLRRDAKVAIDDAAVAQVLARLPQTLKDDTVDAGVKPTLPHAH